MDTDRLTRWLTLAANIGVIAGIFVLVIEIQQSNRMAIASTEIGIRNAYSEFNRSIHSGSNMADLLSRAKNAGVEWTPAEEVKMTLCRHLRAKSLFLEDGDDVTLGSAHQYVNLTWNRDLDDGSIGASSAVRRNSFGRIEWVSRRPFSPTWAKGSFESVSALSAKPDVGFHVKADIQLVPVSTLTPLTMRIA